MKRHYGTHQKVYGSIVGQARLDKIERLRSSLTAQTSIMTAKVSEAEKCTRASYAVTNLLAQNGKPFTDGELVKQALVLSAQHLCPEMASRFSGICLSRNTVASQVSDLAADIREQSTEINQQFDYFSIAVDESTDHSNTAQLAIFVRGINSDFVIPVRFLQLIPLKDRTTGENIYNAVIEYLGENNLDISKLVSVTTDGAPAMVGSVRGFVTLLENHITSNKYREKLIKLHCIIHQESLCAATLHMEEVMKVAVKVVNYIKSNALNHRQFKEFLVEEDTEHSDLTFYNDVRWLSRGKMLFRFLELLEEVVLFLKIKNQMAKFPELEDPEWISKLAFLVDLTSELNSLNLKMQGPDQLVTDLLKHIDIFCGRLEILETQIRASNFTLLPKLKEHPPVDTSELLVFMKNLQLQFSTRFSDIRANASDLLLFSNPLSVDWRKEAQPDFQLELMEIQLDPDIKTVFPKTLLKKKEDKLPLVEFYRSYVHAAGSYPKLTDHAMKMSCIFGSTYVCEQLFSKMKLTKNKHRTNLTDSHLNELLCLSSTSLTPDIDKIIKKKKQCHLSNRS